MVESGLRDFRPDWFSKPADALLGIMKRRNIPIEEVASALDGGMDTMRGLVRGTRAIDKALADSLAVTVGGAPAFWIRRQANYERALDVALHNAAHELDDWLEVVPPPGSKPRGRLSEAKKRAELRKRMEFYGVNSLRAWHVRYGQLRDQAQFRTSRAFSSRDGAISLWLRQGELEAALTTTERWNPERLRSLLGDMLRLSRVSRPCRFLPKLRALGAKAGVAIVVARAPEGCRASGASRLVGPEKAMVLLSFRHLSDDHFWFTLLHECGHLLLHGDNAFVDAEDTEFDSRKEKEANEFASSCIVPPERWEEFSNLRYDRQSILRFSVSLGVAPGLVVGQLQHRQAIPQNRLNFLKRRWKWDEVEDALN